MVHDGCMILPSEPAILTSSSQISDQVATSTGNPYRVKPSLVIFTRSLRLWRALWRTRIKGVFAGEPQDGAPSRELLCYRPMPPRLLPIWILVPGASSCRDCWLPSPLWPLPAVCSGIGSRRNSTRYFSVGSLQPLIPIRIPDNYILV